MNNNGILCFNVISKEQNGVLEIEILIAKYRKKVVEISQKEQETQKQDREGKKET